MYTDALGCTVSPSCPEDPGQKLIQGIASRDRKAMERFYGLYQEKVYRFAASRLNDPEAAADILNEVMLKVWTDGRGFRGESRVLTWVLGITFHKSMDRMRDRYRYPASELDPDLVEEDALDMSVVMERVNDVQRVQGAMARLPDLQRTALHLAFFEDMPYAEIAAVMGCPEGTVKTRVYHGKQALKQLLARIH